LGYKMIKELWCAECNKHTWWGNTKDNGVFAKEFECQDCRRLVAVK